jgi:uncharacterized protein DUF3572
MMKRTAGAGAGAGAEFAARTAIAALGWLAADEQRLSRFLALSGLGPHNLRTAAAEPRFLAAILDYLVSDESLLVEFARDAGRSPDDVARAHAALREPEGFDP